jgi:hypothetical protein
MALIIRSANDDDKDRILWLLNYVFKDQQRSATVRGEQYWNWKFIISPFGKSVLTVAEMDNEIIGVDNLWPWEFKVKGNIYKAFQPCDSVVHPKARGKGIFKNMRLHGLDVIKESNPAFLFNFPNDQSINTNLSLGWYNLGEIPWLVKAINPFNTLNGIIMEKKTEPAILDSIFNLDVELLELLDRREVSIDSYVRPNRKEGYFDWRYLKHPSRKYGMIRHEKGNFSSAAVFTINQRRWYKEMFLVELIGNKDITYDLLSKVISTARSMNVSILALMRNSFFEMDSYWRMGFFRKKAKNMVVLPLDVKLGINLKDYANWSMFACLHDSI